MTSEQERDVMDSALEDGYTKNGVSAASVHSRDSVCRSKPDVTSACGGSVTDISQMSEEQIRQEKRMIMKNILLISLAFLMNFTAYQGLSRLQSSLHR